MSTVENPSSTATLFSVNVVPKNIANLNYWCYQMLIEISLQLDEHICSNVHNYSYLTDITINRQLIVIVWLAKTYSSTPS